MPNSSNFFTKEASAYLAGGLVNRSVALISCASNFSESFTNGKYGVYLKIGKLNYKLPKDCDTQTITLEECLIIAENQPQKSKTKKTFKKK